MVRNDRDDRRVAAGDDFAHGNGAGGVACVRAGAVRSELTGAAMVMLFGSARLTAQQIEKASLFYPQSLPQSVARVQVPSDASVAT